MTLGQPCQQQQQEEEKPQAQFSFSGEGRGRHPLPAAPAGSWGAPEPHPRQPCGGLRGDRPTCQAVTRRQEASQHDTGVLCAVPPPSAASAPRHPVARGPPGSEHSTHEQQQQRTHRPHRAQHRAQSHHHHHHAGVPVASFQLLPTLRPCSPLPCALRTMVGGRLGPAVVLQLGAAPRGAGTCPPRAARAESGPRRANELGAAPGVTAAPPPPPCSCHGRPRAPHGSATPWVAAARRHPEPARPFLPRGPPGRARLGTSRARCGHAGDPAQWDRHRTGGRTGSPGSGVGPPGVPPPPLCHPQLRADPGSDCAAAHGMVPRQGLGAHRAAPAAEPPARCCPAASCLKRPREPQPP